MLISFTIPGEPKGKGRPRFVRSTGMTFTPKDTALYENWVKCCFINSGQQKIEGNVPLNVEIAAYYGIPKSVSWMVRDAMMINNIRPTKKPDCDNIIKIILDSLNGLAYDDDKQVVDVGISKFYTFEEPCVSVRIVPLHVPEWYKK